MSRADTTDAVTGSLDEYIVSSRSVANKKKHRPASPDTDEPACDSTIRDQELGGWKRKTARQTVFQTHCRKPQCFGGDQ